MTGICRLLGRSGHLGEGSCRVLHSDNKCGSFFRSPETRSPPERDELHGDKKGGSARAPIDSASLTAGRQKQKAAARGRCGLEPNACASVSARYRRRWPSQRSSLSNVPMRAQPAWPSSGPERETVQRRELAQLLASASRLISLPATCRRSPFWLTSCLLF